MFTCSNCGYNTTDKSNYNRHCSRKTRCVVEERPVNDSERIVNDSDRIVNHSDRIVNQSVNDSVVEKRPVNHSERIVNQSVNDSVNHRDSARAVNHSPQIHVGIRIDEDKHRGQCHRCERMISKKHVKKHIEICKGVPRNTCCVCFRTFTTQSSHSRHQKMCKGKEIYKEIPLTTNNITNQTINHGTINNNNITNNIIQFGNEHMDLLIERLRIDNDERLKAIQVELKEEYEGKVRLLRLGYDNDREMMKELLRHQKSDHMSLLTDLYFFNKDYPENQTVRKINKKSDLIEFRDGDQWVPEPSRTAVPRFLTALTKYTQEVFDVQHDFSGCSVRNARDIIQHKTKRGDLNDARILQRYAPAPLKLDNSAWANFCKEIYEAFDPADAPWATREDIESTKSQILDQIGYMASGSGLDNFSIFRDGLPLYKGIVGRFPELKRNRI